MRKIIEWSYISADGVFEDPISMGVRDYIMDDAYLRDAVGLFQASDAILLGRSTYEIFAKMWSGVAAGAHPYAARLNTIRKYVFSSSLEMAE
jgi:dihydrofolate reductase